jgi:hypothetical protein
VLAVAVLVIGLLGYGLMPREEQRLTTLLNELCVKANQTRDAATLADLDAALRSELTPSFVARAPELGQDLLGLNDVILHCRDLLTGVPLSFALTDIEVHVSGELARIDANLIVSPRGSSEQHRDLRATQVRFHKVGKAWRIEAIDVDPVRPSQPEARP